MVDSSVVVEIRGNIKDLQKKVATAQRGLDSFSKKGVKSAGLINKSFLNFAVTVAAVTIAIRGMTRAVKAGVTAYAAQEQAEARLEQALKNQGYATQDNIDKLTKLAKARQRVTVFGDEETISAQAMLASFKLNAEQIVELTPLMQDLATMTAKTTGAQADLESTAKLVGLALEGQAGRLKQSGISLTDAETQMLRLADRGEKVNIIMGIMQKNAGGLAVATGQTLTAEVAKLSNAWGDLQEQFGLGFLEGLGGTDDMTKSIEEMQDAAKDLGKELGETLRSLVDGINELNDTIQKLTGGESNLVDVGIGTGKVAIGAWILKKLGLFSLIGGAGGAAGGAGTGVGTGVGTAATGISLAAASAAAAPGAAIFGGAYASRALTLSEGYGGTTGGTSAEGFIDNLLLSIKSLFHEKVNPDTLGFTSFHKDTKKLKITVSEANDEIVKLNDLTEFQNSLDALQASQVLSYIEDLKKLNGAQDDVNRQFKEGTITSFERELAEKSLQQKIKQATDTIEGAAIPAFDKFKGDIIALAKTASTAVEEGHKYTAEEIFGADIPTHQATQNEDGTWSDFISRPGAGVQSFSPDDTIIGIKKPSDLMGGRGVIVSIENIYGTDPQEIAEALQMQLANMVNYK